MNTIDTVLLTFQTEISKKNLLQAKPMKSLFNRLNENNKNCYYPVTMMSNQGEIIYPVQSIGNVEDAVRTELKSRTDKLLSSYSTATSVSDVNSFMDEAERILSYVSCEETGLEDVSLFEYARLQSGIRCATEETGKMLFISMDMSGIQSFIYHMYDSKDVLKNLRTRSFYLEILMENMVDELLGRFALSRANLLYVGGGHAYVILPDKEDSLAILTQYEKDVNEWFLNNFETGLFLAIAYTTCTESDLRNEPVGSYNRVFRDVSASISQKKRHRYSCEEIKRLNSTSIDSGRECRICHTSSTSVMKDGSDVCRICGNLINLSKLILAEKYFIVCKEETGGLPIFPGLCLRICDEQTYGELLKENKVVRTYIKNEIRKGCKCLYVGDYSVKDTIGELVTTSKGVKKLGVIRGDIDNLGHAFVSGFEKSEQNIFRAIAFSKSLSLFFKYNINSILKKGNYNVSIVYSGGDDVFLLGAWNSALDAMMAIEKELQSYSLQSLTISAGFGMFDEKFPISYIADMVGELEDCSKSYPNKNAIALFTSDGSHTFSWKDLNLEVLGNKKLILETVLGKKKSGEQSEKDADRGTAFLYNIVELVRHSDERINLARIAYLLGRLSPTDNPKNEQVHEKYMAFKRFEENLMKWVKPSDNQENRRQFIAAAELYVYEHRNTEVK